jgi:hypothetical protein
VARPYAVGENEETDKKLFIKVVAGNDDSEEMEIALNVLFGVCRTTSEIKGS